LSIFAHAQTTITWIESLLLPITLFYDNSKLSTLQIILIQLGKSWLSRVFLLHAAKSNELSRLVHIFKT